jgi:hypothetical protein
VSMQHTFECQSQEMVKHNLLGSHPRYHLVPFALRRSYCYAHDEASAVHCLFVSQIQLATRH